MTALVFANRATRPDLARTMRAGAARLAHAIDRFVCARATREVPEWRMREASEEIERCRNLMHPAEHRPRR